MNDRKFGLVGHPLGHSYSPRIHELLGSTPYDLIDIAEDELEPFFARRAFDGVNVTIPYKVAALSLVDDASEAARAIGCVNTVVKRPDGTLFGHNTDYDGFAYLIDSLDADIDGRTAAVFGNGGATRAVLAVLRDKGAARIIVFDRKADGKGEPERHGGTCEVCVWGYDALADAYAADLVVQTTPVGMYPACPASVCDLEPFAACGESGPGAKDGLIAVLDVVYNPANTGILMQAERLGIPHAGGLGMLVAQAKAASELFRGIALDDAEIERIVHELSFDMRSIALIGMPGSGKAAIGGIVAQMLGRPFVDMDAEVVREAGKSIPQIFAEEGEEGFRAREHEALVRIGRMSGAVIACGGGVVTRPENYEPLHQNSCIVRLMRDLDELPTDGRPLSQSKGVAMLAQEREHLYRAWGDTVVENKGDVETVAKNVIAACRNLR